MIWPFLLFPLNQLYTIPGNDYDRGWFIVMLILSFSILLETPGLQVCSGGSRNLERGVQTPVRKARWKFLGLPRPLSVT